jgi:hypothetical protein
MQQANNIKGWWKCGLSCCNYDIRFVYGEWAASDQICISYWAAEKAGKMRKQSKLVLWQCTLSLLPCSPTFFGEEPNSNHIVSTVSSRYHSADSGIFWVSKLGCKAILIWVILLCFKIQRYLFSIYKHSINYHK